MAAIPTKPTYIAARNCDYPPNGIICLGSIIYDPLNPERSLNSDHPRASIPGIQRTYLYDYQESSRRVQVNRLTLWAAFAQYILGIGADISGERAKYDESMYHFDNLETRYFSPTSDFLCESLKAPGVRIYLSKTRRFKPIYMITGVKIARGASVTTARSRKLEAAISAGVDATNLGIPVQGGPKATTSVRKSREVSFGASSDFVLAYRLLKITPKLRQGFKWGDYTKGALYDCESGQEKRVGYEEEDFELEPFTGDVLPVTTPMEMIDVEEDCQEEQEGQLFGLVLPRT